MTELNVGVDDGFAAIKVVYRNGNGLEQHTMPSRAAYGLGGATTMAGEAVGGYTTDGQSFTVASDGSINAIDTRFADYAVSPLNRVLIHHALHTAGLGGRACNVGSGLPFDVFYHHPARRSEKQVSLSKMVEKAGGDDLATIGKQSVFPQGAIAWIDTAINNDGEVVADLDAPVAIVDIGGNTTDIAVLLSGRVIDQDRSGTEQMGVLHVTEHLKTLVQQALEIQATDAAIEQALQTRSIWKWTEATDVGALVDEAIDVMASRIYDAVRKRIGDGHDLSRIIAVGGGAAVLGQALEKYPNLEIPPDPAFANARGIWKYLEFVEGDNG